MDYWDHPEYGTLEKRCDALEVACRKMLEVTGGSKHWNGGTHDALKMMETALVQLELSPEETK